MTLTADQIANTTTAAFDVQLRYFAAQDYTDLTLAHYEYGNTPVSWTVSGDTITPAAGWTEVTTRIHAKGSLTYEWSDSVVKWHTTLSGQAYDTAYFSLGCAILCMRKITRTGYNSGWLIWWLGVVDDGEWHDDYRQGLFWERNIRGTDCTLKLTDGPRITVGNLNLAEGASATASSVLATPALEAGYGEFVGSTAIVTADKTVDQRLPTVWISQNVPQSATSTVVGDHSAALMIDEVFFKPLAGYNPEKCWWFEVVNTKTDTQETVAFMGWWLTYNYDGNLVACYFSPGTDLEPGQRVVVCGNRKAFEAITGGAPAAQHVYAADEHPDSFILSSLTKYDGGDIFWYYNLNLDRTTRVPFTLNPTGGYIAKLPGDFNGFGQGINNTDCVKWGTSRAFPTNLDATEAATHWWNGATVDISSIIAGQSIRRVVTGGGVGAGDQDSNVAGDWEIATYPSPGDKFARTSFEWLKIELKPHVSTLAENITTSSTEIEIEEGTVGWPESGDGDIESDAFAYTGRTATTLTGVTGLGTGHTAGALLYPYANSIDQTGWYCSGVRLRRRSGTAYLKRWEVWVSESPDTDTPDGSDPTVILWRNDYDEPHYMGTNGEPTAIVTPDETRPWMQLPVADIMVNFASEGTGRWVRTILINILEMWPETGEVTGARAKINEIEITSDGLDIAESGIVDIPGITAGVMAGYLVDEYTWLQASDFYDGTQGGWGEIGSLALALQALPTVLEDMARMHGCLVRYGLDGQISWERDPWWPGGMTTHLDSALSPIYSFAPDNVRGEIKFSNSNPTVTGVAINGTDGEGLALERVVFPASATGSNIKEFNDLVVARQSSVRELAWKFYVRELRQNTCTLVVKGVGEWCWPTQTLYIEWPDGVNQGVWIIERVTWQWNLDQERKTWETMLECRYFIGDAENVPIGPA